MKTFVNKTVVVFISLLSSAALAQQMSSSENSCRAKAKEIAAQTYNTCITESRTAQIDQIRKEYQQQLSELKARYDKELQKMGSKEALKDLDKDISAKDTSVKSPAQKITTAKEISSTDITASARKEMKPKKTKKSASTGSRPKPTKGIAKTLPTRKEVKAQPAPEPEWSQQDESAASGSDSAPVLLSSDEAAAAAQNEMDLTLVPSTDSGSEQY